MYSSFITLRPGQTELMPRVPFTQNYTFGFLRVGAQSYLLQNAHLEKKAFSTLKSAGCTVER